MRWFAVTASRLHQRKLVLNKNTIKSATLFPFFDGEGEVAQVLVVDAETAELITFNPRECKVHVLPWGQVQVTGPTELLDKAVLAEIAPLWHYDPWWLLKEKRYEGLSSVPVLKKTNCVDLFLTPPDEITFAQDLRRLEYITAEADIHPYDSDMLPRRDEAADVAAASGGWELDPFWG